MNIILKSGILKKVDLTKCGDLKLVFLFPGGIDAGYAEGDTKLLRDQWADDAPLDIEISSAKDSTPQE